jgi:hypothetical protein
MSGAGGSSEIQLSVRIRPGPSPAVDVARDGKVTVGVSSSGGESFGYPSHVVKGSDQRVAFEALASILISRAKDGYNCTLMAYGQTGSGVGSLLPLPGGVRLVTWTCWLSSTACVLTDGLSLPLPGGETAK